MDIMIKDEVRKKVLSQAHGKVLEAGGGTGKNLQFYPPDCQVTGIDFSPGMLDKARKRVEGRPGILILALGINLETKMPQVEQYSLTRGIFHHVLLGFLHNIQTFIKANQYSLNAGYVVLDIIDFRLVLLLRESLFLKLNFKHVFL